MNWSEDDKRLGMDRPITRRHFLDGVAAAAGAAVVFKMGGLGMAQAQETAAGATAYPPSSVGLRGQTDGAQAVMHALRIEEGVVPGAISVYRFAELPRFIQHTMLFVLGRKYAKIRTSMLQDVERGVKTEVDEIHGAIVLAATGNGVVVPKTEAVLRTVHALEDGRSKFSTDFSLLK